MRVSIFGGLLLALAAGSLAAGSVGPDVVTSNLGPEIQKYGTRDVGPPGSPRLVTGYAITSVACNIGDQPAAWVDSNNQHPVIATQMYRLWNGRFEQIGLSWVKHSFCAADQQSCINLVPGAVFQGDTVCATLGLFAFDTYTASLNGNQYTLGPRSEINPTTGVFAYPFTLGWNQLGDCLYKRLAIANTDLNPTLYAGARYFCEVQYVAPDESPSVRANNASYREVVVGPLTSGSSQGGCGTFEQGRILTFSGAVVPMKPAIEAWKTVDPGVALVYADVPGEAGGRIAVGGRALSLGGGQWRYEYAIYNHNSHRGIGSFSLPKSSDPSVVISGVGFHAPDHHSGEPASNDDWTPTVREGSIAWSTDPFITDPNASALRWGTVANFRFQTNRAPLTGTVTLGLFRPGSPGDPATLRVAGLPLPVESCPADFDASGAVTLQDLFDFLAAYFSGLPAADFNRSGGVSVQDVFDFLAAWLGGC